MRTTTTARRRLLADTALVFAARSALDPFRSCGTSSVGPGLPDTSPRAAQNPSAPSPTASTGARIRAGRRRAAGPPRALGLPVPVRKGDQLLGAVGTDPDEHEQAQPLLVQADVDVDAVGPHVHVVQPDRSRPANALASSCHCTVNFVITGADRPAEVPRNASNAGAKSDSTGRAGTAAAAPPPPSGRPPARPTGRHPDGRRRGPGTAHLARRVLSLRGGGARPARRLERRRLTTARASPRTAHAGEPAALSG